MKVLIMAGGTGGHIMPALAVAKMLQEKGHQVEWLGTSHGMENQLIPKANIPLHTITITGLRGKGLTSLLLAPFKLLRAILQSLSIIKKIKPDAVLGMGGFASGPGGLAAGHLRIPLIIHEQNSIPGLTNRFLAKFAKYVCEAFPNSFANNINAIYTGNPVRQEILQVQRSQQLNNPLHVLILGGSQGALSLNETVPKALSGLNVTIRHQAGKHYNERVKQLYQELHMDAQVDSFIENMAEAYQWADIVICRAGALTISEIMTTGIPSILIPYPHAVDDHQSKNAKFLVDADAAILLPQQQLTAEKLHSELKKLIDNQDELQQMATNAWTLRKPEATELVVEKVCYPKETVG